MKAVKTSRIPSISRRLAVWLLGITSAIALAANEAEQPVRISLDQIEAMVYREQFAEALLPLANVATGERSPRWNKLIERAAAGHLRTMMREASAGGDAVGEVLLKDYPHLASYEDFQSVYTQLVRRNAEACLDRGADGYDCASTAHRMLQNTSREAGYYLEFADLFDKRVSVAVAAPFLQLSEEKNRAVAPSPAAKLKGCKSDTARRILTRGFSLPPGEPKTTVLAVAETYCRETAKKILTGLDAKLLHVKQTLCAFSETRGRCRVPAKK